MNKVKTFEKEINGITVLYIKVPFSLNTHVGFFSLSGSYAENEKDQGLAHYLEHMFFKGTKNRDLFKISDDAALLGAKQNAYTSSYTNQYYLNVPKVNTDGAIELLCDMMFNPLFPEEEIKKERTVIQEERKMYEDDPQSFFFDKIGENFFNFQVGHKIIGTEETINSLNREDFLRYHSKMYGLDNTILVIASDMDCKNIFFSCEKHFSNHPFKHNGRDPMQSEILSSDNKQFIFGRKNIQQTYMVGAFPTKGAKDPNNALKECMMSIIGGGMFSLFFKEIREKLGLCYSVFAMDYLKNSEQSVSIFYSQTEPEKVKLVQDKMIEIVTDVKENGFEKDEFECGKASELGRFCRTNSSVSSMANSAGTIYLLGEEPDFEKYYQDLLNLTLDDVNAYASENLPDVDDIYWGFMNPEK